MSRIVDENNYHDWFQLNYLCLLFNEMDCIIVQHILSFSWFTSRFLQPNGENISCACYEIHGVDKLINNWNSYKNEPTGPTLTLFYQQLKI